MGTSDLGSTDDVLFSCICKEPDGDVLRKVRHFKFTNENLIKLYNQVSKFPTLMGVEIKNIEDMIRYFVNEDSNGSITPKGLCLVIDNFTGLFWLTDIKLLHEASVHYTFFDRRHKGRIDLCKKALEYTFKQFQFNRLWTQVPITATKVMIFVEELGFIKVGRPRLNVCFRGKFHDSNLYDMLKDEFLNPTGKIENGIKFNGELRATDNTSTEPSEST